MGRPLEGSSAADLGGSLCIVLFAATVVAGIVGAAYALVLAAFATDPGPDRRLGVLIMAGATGASLVAAAAGSLFDSLFDAFYVGTYPIFFTTLCVAAVLSIGGESIANSLHSSASLPATLSNCTSRIDGNSDVTGPQTVYDCTYTWAWDGVEHQATLDADGDYPDGTPSSVHVNPSTGGVYEDRIAPFIVTPLELLITTPLAVFSWWLFLGRSND